MDKYQRVILRECKDKNFIFYCCCRLGKEVESGQKEYGVFDEEKDTFTVKQDEDITITQYVLVVRERVARHFEKIQVYTHGKWEKVALSPFGSEEKAYKIVLDFNDKAKKIKLSFKDGLADDYTLTLRYEEADKQAYYERIEKARKEELLKTANVQCATSFNTVNVYFQPCCKEYGYTEIELYVSARISVLNCCDWNFIAKRRVADGEFYFSQTGLASAGYSFVLKQYAKDGKLLLETEHLSFHVHDAVRTFNH